MKQVLIFDVDGTLTGPRRVMYDDFARFFRCIVTRYPVYLVTGSDLAKLEEQIPAWIFKDVAGAFTCSGNEYWREGRMVYRRDHRFPGDLIQFLECLIEKSPYQHRTGNHIEFRTGTLNLSVVGRNATPAERHNYLVYDRNAAERIAIQEAVNKGFAAYEANCGGQISVDIAPVGWNKSQVYFHLKKQYANVDYHFFGDNIRPGGNDNPLAQVIKGAGSSNGVHAVGDHYETWKLLQSEFAASDLRSA